MGEELYGYTIFYMLRSSSFASVGWRRCSFDVYSNLHVHILISSKAPHAEGFFVLLFALSLS